MPKSYINTHDVILKPLKTKAMPNGLIERTSSILDEIISKNMYKYNEDDR